jgi:hypothetical protein
MLTELRHLLAWGSTCVYGNSLTWLNNSCRSCRSSLKLIKSFSIFGATDVARRNTCNWMSSSRPTGRVTMLGWWKFQLNHLCKYLKSQQGKRYLNIQLEKFRECGRIASGTHQRIGFHGQCQVILCLCVVKHIAQLHVFVFRDKIHTQ